MGFGGFGAGRGWSFNGKISFTLLYVVGTSLHTDTPKH